MRKLGVPLFENSPPLSSALHPLYGSGMGFAPDVMSQLGYSELPEASGTQIEVQNPNLGATDNVYPVQPPYGLDGMMPCSMIGYGTPTQSHLNNSSEEGVGGAGSFITTPAYGAKG